MNEHLKFSWGHIIAFLAMIAIGYISFMGMTYATNGNFLIASIVMVIVLLIMMGIFIVPQYLKAVDGKFKRCILYERILIYASPFVFCAAMLPYTHFWTVLDQEELVLTRFTEAINASKDMFADYDKYADQRIKSYDALLDSVKGTGDAAKYGITSGREAMQVEQMKRTIRLLLTSDNYTNLKTDALKWIDNANQGASVWNVFLFGNTRQIKNSIADWSDMLSKNSAHVLYNEQQAGANEVKPFDKATKSVDHVLEGLDNLSSTYTTTRFPNIPAIGTSLLLFFMMILPYLLQDRYDKSPYRLFGMKAWATDGATSLGSGKVAVPSSYDGADDDYTPSAPAPASHKTSESAPRSEGGRRQQNEDYTEDDFGSFTL